MHQTQQAAAACDEPQPGRQTRSGPAGQRQPDVLQHAAAQWRPAGVFGGHAVDLLSERPNRTTAVVAEEAAHPQPQHHWLTGYRTVGQLAVIAAVHPVGPAAAGRTGSVLCHDARPDQRAGSGPVDLLDRHARQVWEEYVDPLMITRRP